VKEKIVGLAVLVGLIYFGVQWLKSWKPPKEQTLPGYTQGLKRSRLKAVTAVEAYNLQGLTDAVWKFKASQERFPTSLQELVEAGYIDHVPQGFHYDPATGAVSPQQ
jgi:hypothetical protein